MKENNNKNHSGNGLTEISGAEAVINILIAEGVDTVFGYPGGAIMPIYDNLMDVEDKVTHILTRHEQGGSPCCPGVCNGYR